MWGSPTPSPCNCLQCNETPEEFEEGYLKHLYDKYKKSTDNPLTYEQWEAQLASVEVSWNQK